MPTSTTTLPSLPYEIRLAIACELDELRDVVALARSCTAFAAVLQGHSTNIYSRVAANRYRASGCWEELVRLVRAAAARERLKGLEEQRLEPGVYIMENRLASKGHVITKSDVPRLLKLLNAARGVCALGASNDGVWPERMKDDTVLRDSVNLVLLDVVVAGKSMVEHPECGAWRDYEFVDFVTQRLVLLNDLRNEEVGRVLGVVGEEGEKAVAEFRRFVSWKVVACLGLLNGNTLDGAPGWPLWS